MLNVEGQANLHDVSANHINLAGTIHGHDANLNNVNLTGTIHGHDANLNDVSVNGDISIAGNIYGQDAILNDVSVNGDISIAGNISVDGSFNFNEIIQNITTINNTLLVSTQLDISNQGTGPALKVSQLGDGDDQDVALFNAGDEGDAMKIDSSGNTFVYKNMELSGHMSLKDISCNGIVDISGDVTMGTLSLKSNTTITPTNRIPVFITDPSATAQALVTRTPTELREDIGALSVVDLGITDGTTNGPVITNSGGTNATIPTASASASGIVTTTTQSFAGTKTFDNRITASISGNAGSVTNGVYTTGNQTIGGHKNFSSAVRIGGELNKNNNALDVDAHNTTDFDALGLRATNNTNQIVNFYNSVGTNRGNIQGVNENSIRYNTTSDRRKKSDIIDLPNGLEKVMKLKPRAYRWKEGHELDDGFIAQEVFETLPHLIPFNRFKCDISQNDVYHGKLCSCCNIEKKANGEDYIFGIDYGKFTPYLCKAIQEQQHQIETLKKQYDELLTRIQELEL